MSTISASTTSTTAYKVTADTTGTLVFQTGASPTTAMTLGSDQSVTFAGAQTYTGAATFTTGITVQGLTVGKGAGAVSTNTAVGASALGGASQSGNHLAAFGKDALGANSSGVRSVAAGSGALSANTTGSYNVGVGTYDAGGAATLASNTTGSNLVAVGIGALASNTTASNNTAVGYQASYTSTAAVGVTSIGYQANYSMTTTGNTYSTAVGYQAAKGAAGATNYYDVALGAFSLYSVTTGYNNTCLGINSGYYITTGYKNTILGSYNGNQGGLDIRTASNYIVLSDGDGNPRGYFDGGGTWNGQASVSNNVIAQWFNQSATNPYGLYLALTNASPNNTSQYLFRAVDSTTTCYTIYSNGTTTGRSDARLKKNIVDATPKLDDVCRLQVRNYEWIESNGGEKEIGLIAQEVEQVFPKLVITHDLEKDGDDFKEVKYSTFVPILLKAIQELNAKVDAQAAEIAALKGQA